MPNLNELKALNKPQEIPQKLTTPYLPQVSAIPTEEWDAMLSRQTVLLERMAALGQYISTLPTTPEIEKAIRDYCQGIYDNQGDMLCRVINDQHRRISQTVNDKIDKSQDNLKWQLQQGFKEQTELLGHRDVLPWKLKIKWTAMAALLDSVLYLAKSVEDSMNPYDPEAERQKYAQERMRRKSGKKKKQKHGYSPQYKQDMEQSI